MSQLRNLLQKVVDLLDAPNALSNVSEVRQLIAAANIKTNVHIGKSPDSFTENMVYEWCLGQFADVIDNQAWFVMNS